MPAIRNARGSQGRHSGRLENRVPIAYDNEGWEVPLGHATLQDLYLTRGDSLRLTTCSSPPPSTTSHSVLSVDLEADPIPEMVALALNGNGVHVRRRSNSAISAASSTSSSSAVPTPSSTTDMTRNVRAKSKPYSRPGNRIPRPRNAFIIFRSYFNDKARSVQPPADGTKTNQNEVSKQAAKVWRSMTAEQRKPFQIQAKEEKERHAEKYPDYRYAPNGKKGAPAKPKPRAAPPVSKRKARQARAEYTDSESESEDSYSDRSATSITAPPPMRNLRPRAGAPRYISPEPPSSPEDSPTPTPTSSPAPESRAVSPDLALGEYETFWVENEDIPRLSLPLPLSMTSGSQTGQGVDPGSMCMPAFVQDQLPSIIRDPSVPWASASTMTANEALDILPLLGASSSFASISYPGEESSAIPTGPQYISEEAYGTVVGTVADIRSIQSGATLGDVFVDFDTWVVDPYADFDAADMSGSGAELH